MKELLKMIESVDPSDTAKLDEIDARVWCYFMEYKFEKFDGDRVWFYSDKPCPINGINQHRLMDHNRYTSSEDALRLAKNLVTIPWTISFIEGEQFNSVLPTKELAALYYTIQAVNCQRNSLKESSK